MNELKWPMMGLAGSLALAGSSIVFADSLPYAGALIGVAVVLVVATSVWSVWESFPRVFTDSERPKETARMIYRRAARHGGTIHATHIFPLNRDPGEDYAVEELGKTASDIDITFHRIILLDSITDERLWLAMLFKELQENIAKHFYTLSSYPLLFPRITKAILPRLNLILYESLGGGSCYVLVGLDRLHLAGVTVNFALYSRSKRVHRALLRYFEQITGAGHFRSSNSIEEYDATQLASSHVKYAQAVVSRVVDYAETTAGIVFVGMFGSIARAALGFAADTVLEDINADVDLLIVYDPRIYGSTEDDLRARVVEALDAHQTRVTWGPDLSSFYPLRDEQRINVDIECHQVGSDFYSKNRLLGYSIFRYFIPLYSADQRAVVSYLDVPMSPLTSQERWSLVMSDRQGLQPFKDRLAKAPNATDPRRLCTHVLRNSVWAITGTWPSSGKSAGQFLKELPDWTDEPAIKDAVGLLGLSTKEVRNDMQTCFKQVRAAIDCVFMRAQV